MGSKDDELKARLLAYFCPILRFDAAEKHYPISAETFISSSVLLRKPKSASQIRRELRKQRRQRRQRKLASRNEDGKGGGAVDPAVCTSDSDSDSHEDGDEDEEEDWDEDSCDDDSEDDDGSGGGGGAHLAAAAAAAVAAAAAKQSDGTKVELPQACGESDQKKDWEMPEKGEWTVVDLPPNAQSWNASTLLDEQRRDTLHDFRLEPRCCIWNGEAGDLSKAPCYAFADLLDPSKIAPFIRRSGLGPVYELKYAFLYGYNGTTFAIPGTSVGVHRGDLEHVTIRVDARRMMTLEVFFAAHGTGEGKWVPSNEFYRQIETLEAAEHPGVPLEVPESAREFLELESSGSPAVEDASDTGKGAVRGDASARATGGGGPNHIDSDTGGRGERAVIYPARNGHASYHMPKRWRRFAGLGDDICGGDGKVWRPVVVQLEHPRGRTPPWLQYRGYYGSIHSISSEEFWKSQGEPPRRCSPEAKYRSLLEEGLVPDRGIRLGSSRRMLQGNGDRGVWLERHRQTESRVPLSNMWTRVPGLSSPRPRDEDPPRFPGREWLAEWGFLRDKAGGCTDAAGWSYYGGHAGHADTGIAGRPKNSGISTHRSRGRVWFRVAATPEVAREVEEAHRQTAGKYPRRILALAALAVAGRGDAVTPESLLQTLGENVGGRGGAGSGRGASSRGRGDKAESAAAPSVALKSSLGEPICDGSSAADSLTSFASVAARSLG